MSMICPKCGKELDDDARVCECGETIAEEVKTTLADESAVEEDVKTTLVEEADPEKDVKTTLVEEADPEEDVKTTLVEASDSEEEAVITAEEGDAEEAGAEEAEEASDETLPLQGAAAAPVEAVPLQDQENKEKKNKYLGLGIAVGAGVVALLVAIVCCIILLIPTFLGPQKAVDEYINAYKQSDFEGYFSHDYGVMFKNDNLDEQVEMAKQYMGDATNDDIETKVLGVSDLTSEAKDSLKKQLEAAGYHDTDKIEEIKLVNLQISRPSESEDGAEKDYWANMFYALKVDGNWYFATSF